MMYSRPAIILTAPRSGGTFLASCLSNHPDIFCARGEPLLDGMPWKASLPGATDTQILMCIISQFGYKTGMCKVTYDQLSPDVQHLTRVIRAKVVHLVRSNVIRCCLSQLMTGTSATYAHGTGQMNSDAIAIDAVEFVKRCRQHVMWQSCMQDWIDRSGLESIVVTYDELVGGEGRNVDQMTGQASNMICGFLGVDYPVVLRTHLRKVNPVKMRSMVLNWEELRSALAKTEFSEMI